MPRASHEIARVDPSGWSVLVPAFPVLSGAPGKSAAATRPRAVAVFFLSAAVIAAAAAAQRQAAAQTQGAPAGQTAAARPAVVEWADEFDGDRLDQTKWETYTFAGGGGGKIEVKDKQLKMRGGGGSRSGVRSKQMFRADRFFVEAALAKVATRTPEPGEEGFPPGTAVLTVLFDGNPANRIEWLLRSDGIFEAWVSQDGKMERADNGKLATKEKTPRLGIARRGEQVFFMLNGQVGLERTVRGLSANFKPMLYGFGTTENSWDSIRVQTLKQ